MSHPTKLLTLRGGRGQRCGSPAGPQPAAGIWGGGAEPLPCGVCAHSRETVSELKGTVGCAVGSRGGRAGWCGENSHTCGDRTAVCVEKEKHLFLCTAFSLKERYTKLSFGLRYLSTLKSSIKKKKTVLWNQFNDVPWRLLARVATKLLLMPSLVFNSVLEVRDPLHLARCRSAACGVTCTVTWGHFPQLCGAHSSGEKLRANFILNPTPGFLSTPVYCNFTKTFFLTQLGRAVWGMPCIFWICQMH